MFGKFLEPRKKQVRQMALPDETLQRLSNDLKACLDEEFSKEEGSWEFSNQLLTEFYLRKGIIPDDRILTDRELSIIARDVAISYRLHPVGDVQLVMHAPDSLTVTCRIPAQYIPTH